MIIKESGWICTLESRSEATPLRRSTSTDKKQPVSETSPSSAKDSSPTQVLPGTQVLPSRRSSHSSSGRQQLTTSPVQTTARNNVDSKRGNMNSHSWLGMLCVKLCLYSRHLEIGFFMSEHCPPVPVFITAFSF